MSEDIVHLILTRRRDLSRETVLDLVERKKAESGGFLSDQGAAMLVAQDLNVEVGRAGPAEIKIRDVVSGLSDVTIAGTVTNVSMLQEFRRQDGTLGRVLRFTLTDSTGEVNCVAWDQQAERLANQQLQGRTASISHGYTREGLGGKVELFIGDKGEVQIGRGHLEPSEPATDQLANIADIPKLTGEVNLLGIVKTPPRISEFKRADGLGKVLRTKLMDKTGRITIVAWNEKADDLLDLNVGDAVQLSGGRVKTSMSGSPEVHLDSLSHIKTLESVPVQLADVHLQPLKISQIKANMRDVDLVARILKVQSPVEVKRTIGETTKVMRLLLADETGLIQASLWDDKADLNVHTGKVVLIEDAVSRERLGEVSISVGKAGVVTVDPKPGLEVSPPASKKIAELPHGGGPIAVEGRIVSQPSLRQVQTSKGDTVDLAEIQLRDGSGECRVVFWRDLARQAAEMQQGSRIRLYGVYPRLGLAGGIELSSGPMTCFETMSELAPQVEPPTIHKINELKEGVEGTLQGIILELSGTSHASLICGRCGLKIEPEDDGPLCKRCGDDKDIDISATLFIRIDDGSGFLDSVVEGPGSNSLLAQDTRWILKSLIEKKTPRIQLTVETLSRLIGMRVEAEGVLSKDEKTGKGLFRVKTIREVGSSLERPFLSRFF